MQGKVSLLASVTHYKAQVEVMLTYHSKILNPAKFRKKESNFDVHVFLRNSKIPCFFSREFEGKKSEGFSNPVKNRAHQKYSNISFPLAYEAYL